MKFLVLALCVCAASAASFGSASSFVQQPFQQTYQQRLQKPAVQVFAQAVSAPVAVAPVAYNSAKAIVEAPLVAAKKAYSAVSDAEAVIVRSDSEVSPNGFNYYYETNNGIAAQASGLAKSVGNEQVLAVQGSYKYTGSDGKDVVLTYVADENGFQPQSDVLPVAPAIPEAILRSLEYIRTHRQPENNKRENY